MCGIAGVINFREKKFDQNVLSSMTESLHHRGPDDSGYFSDDHVGMGFRRLSIIDLSAGHQPMGNEDDSIMLVFNGEIYNFEEIRDVLLGKGHQFKTEADSEVIVHAYEQWGVDCVHKFNGMFAFALYDQKEKKVVLARDRLGIKPLYYAHVNGTTLFASEMKAILQYPEFERRANYAAISSYLTFRYPQGDQPVFEGMKRLHPGHVLEITVEGNHLTKYWEIPFHAKKDDLGEKYYLKEIERLLTLAVKRRMISDVPLGALLSGGLDSSVVVALMSQLTDQKVKTFSIGFENQGYDESPFAKKVSDHCGAEHHYLTLSQTDYMGMWRDMIRQKDAPLSIPHEVALNRICKELKRHITVVISGEGADELFGGYGRVQRSPMDYKKIQFVKKFIPESLRRPFLQMMGSGDKTEEWLAINSHMDHFFSVYNWVPFQEKWDLFTDAALNTIMHDQGNINRWSRDFEHVKDGSVYDRILYMFEKNHLICLLDRLDSMSMAASVEARVPFVDHELVEFVSTIPFKHKMKWHSTFHRARALFMNSFKASEYLDSNKYILRKFSEKLIPTEIAKRKKLGFPVPLDAWIKQGMVDHAKEILLDPVCISRGIFKKDKLEQLLNNQQHLEYDFWGKKIWMLMNVEMWFKEFIDQPLTISEAIDNNDYMRTTS